MSDGTELRLVDVDVKGTLPTDEGELLLKADAPLKSVEKSARDRSIKE